MIRGPESNARTDGLIAFAPEKINQFPSYSLAIRSARRNEKRNVDQATIGSMVSEGVNAEAFNVPSGVTRDDNLLSLTDGIERTTKLPPLML